jgi:hypothetical protein
VCEYGDGDYVFLKIISPKIWELSRRYFGNGNFYKHFKAHVALGYYLVWQVYGNPAFRLDGVCDYSRDVLPAIKLDIIIGEGEDTVEALPPGAGEREAG